MPILSATYSHQAMIFTILFLSLLYGINCRFVMAVYSSANQSNEHNEALVVSRMIKWAQSEGGTVNDKVEIRRMDPEDVSSPYGVFAKESIKESETIMIIPKHCYIMIDDAEDMDVEYGWQDAYNKNLCKLSHRLMDEMRLGEESKYAPYISYLKTQKVGQLPANWSAGGKRILRELYPEGSQVVDWIDQNFKDKKCIGDDPFESHMVEMTVQRCFDIALIPVWDMVNHDNGNINVATGSYLDEPGIKVWASKDIQSGEEIYATYDKCVDCYDIQLIWGTGEILKDFGFVEAYPHRYVYEEEDIWFEVCKNENNELSIKWDSSGEYGMITEEGVEFLEDELERIEKVGKRLLNKENVDDVPYHEWRIIQAYYDTLITDLEFAIEAAEELGFGKDEL
mmetsp:Transcript_4056/g.7779  ORF Transcript_4056/g.7779 Transcript_4056/m.7779 type:complete len:396 (-) Transcript_4056:185-1372(-)